MRSIKKITALILSAALVTSLTPMIPDMGIKAYADTAGETSAPSVQAYADVDTLTSDIFTPKYKADGLLDSDKTKVAKLKFGKNDKSAVQEWYILGPDKNIAGEKSNIAIFAENDIINYLKFHSDSSYHEYNICGDTDISYVKGDAPTQVAPNHYGGSDIRAALRKMAGEEEDSAKNYDKYFTTTEKAMMQKTTVLTHDYDEVTDSSDYKLYTTSDKLYLASGKDNSSNYDFNIYVGSVNKSGDDYAAADEYTSKKLWVSNYWVRGNFFWLRSSYLYNSSDEFVVNPDSSDVLGAQPSHGNISFDDGTKFMINVRPASNLNLKDVLFSSAAEATSAGESSAAKAIDIGTEIAPNAAMTLRLDGSGQNIGTAAKTDNKIFVKRGSTAGKVSLVVQGKYFNESDASKNTDWYFSKLIEGNGTTAVSTDDIKAALDSASIDSAVGASVDLDNCKVWLEIPLGDGSTLSYAVQATDHTHEYSTSKWTSDADKHWHECTEVYCPDPDKGKKDAVAHNYGSDDTWYYDENYHYKKCTVCDSNNSIKSDTKKAHTYGTDGKCTTCGYDIKNVHDLEQVDEVEPTCTKVGYKSYYRCKDEGCDVRYYSELGFLIRFTDMSEIELPKAEHVEGDSYSHSDSEHWLTCVNCDEPLKKASHKLGSDYSSDDESHWKVCTICEAELEISAHNLADGFFADDNHHWKECKDCGAKLEMSEHNPSTDFSQDKDKHWKVCVTCGEKLDEGAHSYKGNTCTVCGYVRELNVSSGGGSSSETTSDGSLYSGRDGSWSRDDKGWRFMLTDGGYVKGSRSLNRRGTYDEQIIWYSINGKSYAFGQEGYLKSGWVYNTADGSWYYCDENNGRETGWHLDASDSCWYYLDPNTGAMLTGWQLINGKWYFLAGVPGASTWSFDEAGDKWVYNNTDGSRPYGSLYIDTLTPDGFYVGSDGYWVE